MLTNASGVEVKDPETKVQIWLHPSYSWQKLAPEEKRLFILHELTHTAQYAILKQKAKELVKTDPLNYGSFFNNFTPEEKEQKIFLLYYGELGLLLRKPLEVVPNIVDLLYYYHLPQKQKEKIESDDLTFLYPAFLKAFGSELTFETTPADLLGSENYPPFRKEVIEH